jgi:hypothetical protein
MESGSMEVATRLIDSITERFFFLAAFPYAVVHGKRELEGLFG